MRKKRVKVGKYRTVFRGLIYEIKQAKAVLPSGEVKTYERAHRQPSVNVLAIDSKSRLLLNREYRIKYGGYRWRLFAGRVERGERPIAAAQRELREEAGVKAKKLKLFYIADSGQSLEWKKYTYIATGLSPAPLKKDEGEDITVVPTSLGKVMRMVRAGKIESEALAYLIFKLYNERKKWKI